MYVRHAGVYVGGMHVGTSAWHARGGERTASRYSTKAACLRVSDVLCALTNSSIFCRSCLSLTSCTRRRARFEISSAVVRRKSSPPLACVGGGWDGVRG